VRWTRRLVLPPDARDSLPFQGGERVLASARLSDGTWVAATQRALLLPGRRIDWVTVAHAEWLDEEDALRVDQMAGPDGSTQRHRLVLDQPGRLPEVLRERVMSSIVASRHVPVLGRTGVRVVARRVPGQDELVWQVVVDRGLDPGDERVRAAGQAGITALRRELDA
jgi:hypothetical protein